jgi:hypothetical protein
VLVFNFDELYGGDQIKLGVDFKFKIKADWRNFHFWLNSESVRARDLPTQYEKEGFTITDCTNDEELMKRILPRDVQILEKHSHFKNINQRHNDQIYDN